MGHPRPWPSWELAWCPPPLHSLPPIPWRWFARACRLGPSKAVQLQLSGTSTDAYYLFLLCMQQALARRVNASFMARLMAICVCRQAQGYCGRPIKYNGMMDVMQKAWAREGLRGLYKASHSCTSRPWASVTISALPNSPAGLERCYACIASYGFALQHMGWLKHDCACRASFQTWQRLPLLPVSAGLSSRNASC